VLTCGLDARGSNDAVVVGTEARIELGSFFFTPTVLRVLDHEDRELERFEASITGRGMQYQAEAMERLIAAGGGEDPRMPLTQSVAIMGTLDAIRDRIGLRY
jgi:hypothetical protein